MREIRYRTQNGWRIWGGRGTELIRGRGCRSQVYFPPSSSSNSASKETRKRRQWRRPAKRRQMGASSALKRSFVPDTWLTVSGSRFPTPSATQGRDYRRTHREGRCTRRDAVGYDYPWPHWRVYRRQFTREQFRGERQKDSLHVNLSFSLSLSLSVSVYIFRYASMTLNYVELFIRHPSDLCCSYEK